MTRTKTQFQCNECGTLAPKWAGQCAECQSWNSIAEIVTGSSPPGGHFGQPAEVLSLHAVHLDDEPRQRTGISELDRVIGGGVVGGSVILIGGDPGIGKSTLLLQTLSGLRRTGNISSLYVTGEESAQQVGLRAQRLGLPLNDLRLFTDNKLERVLDVVVREQPQIVVIDSIQTIYSELLQSAPGSVAQVRECAARLVQFAKQSGAAVFLVGHVTKEGVLAGPRVLEHMVDTVLYFEGDSGSRYRIVRAVKNRFGAVNELGIFAMTDKGLREVNNPSAIFLSRGDEQVSGSIVMVMREGTRPILIEVQALVDTSHLSNPRRVILGMEHNRLAMLLAVLHRHAGIVTADQDVYINVVGGVSINETGADLAILLAIISSLRNQPLPMDLVVFGEVGLSGEIRPVQSGLERLNEAAKHGFKNAIIPVANKPRRAIDGLNISTAGNVQAAIQALEPLTKSNRAAG